MADARRVISRAGVANLAPMASTTHGALAPPPVSSTVRRAAGSTPARRRASASVSSRRSTRGAESSSSSVRTSRTRAAPTPTSTEVWVDRADFASSHEARRAAGSTPSWASTLRRTWATTRSSTAPPAHEPSPRTRARRRGVGVRAQTVATHEAPPTWSAATTSPTATSPRSRASWMLTTARLAHRTGRSVSRAASIRRRPSGVRSSGWITVRRLGRPCSAATRSTASPIWRATTSAADTRTSPMTSGTGSSTRAKKPPITVRPRARSTPQLHVPSAAQPTSAGICPFEFEHPCRGGRCAVRGH